MRRRMLLLLFLASAGAACGREPPPRDTSGEGAEIAVPVAAQPARRGRVRSMIRTTGVVTPAAGAEFLAVADEPARIIDIPPAEGARVARGDVLVRFDVPAAAAETARRQADAALAQTLLENARIAHARARELVDRGIISRREMENADRDLANAQADAAKAVAAVRDAEAAAARAVIRAPFAGIVVRRLHEPGDAVPGIASDPILRLIDPDRLEVTAPIPAADAPRVLPGAAARVTSQIEPVGLVVATRAAAPAGAAEAIARLAFAAGSALPVDSRIDIEIDGEERVDAVLVPVEAILRTGGETAVLIAAGNRAERRPVTTGIQNAESVEIVSGVDAGELVITRGQAGLADGAAISVDQPRP